MIVQTDLASVTRSTFL